MSYIFTFLGAIEKSSHSIYLQEPSKMQVYPSLYDDNSDPSPFQPSSPPFFDKELFVWISHWKAWKCHQLKTKRHWIEGPTPWNFELTNEIQRHPDLYTEQPVSMRSFAAYIMQIWIAVRYTIVNAKVL